MSEQSTRNVVFVINNAPYGNERPFNALGNTTKQRGVNHA